MSVLSRTNYHKQVVSDALGCTTAFTRASVKPDFDAGVDTASGSPQFQHIPLAKYHISEYVTDHADGSTTVGAVDKAGRVWGFTDDDRYVYLLDPSGAGTWSKVKDFGANQAMKSIFCSRKSGYIFVSVNDTVLNTSKVYRSVLADGTDDWVAVLTMTGSDAYAMNWSWADDAATGYIWVAEYGGDKDGDADDAQRVYMSIDEGANWTLVFCFGDDFPADWHAGIHLHNIIWNPYNSTLYIAHGDTDPNYLYKGVNGASGSFSKIDYRYQDDTAVYTYLQPTSSVVLPNGNIVWFDDTGKRGAWLHDTSADTFKFYNMGTLANNDFFDAKLINSVIYAHANTSGGEFSIINPNNLKQRIVIDRTDATLTGFHSIAGIGNDGYLYVGINVAAGKTTKRYRLPGMLTKYGLTVDPSSNNGFLDPFNDIGAGSGGWTDYSATYHSDTGGKYKNHHLIARSTVSSNKVTLTNLVDPVILSLYMRRHAQSGTPLSDRYYWRQYQDDAPNPDIDLDNSAAKSFGSEERSEDGTWVRYTWQLDPATLHVDTDKIAMRCAPLNSNWAIDCLHVEQTTKPRAKLPRLAAGSAADAILTTLGAALPAVCTVSGIITSNYQFDSVGLYSLWAAKNVAGTNWLKLIFYNGQIMLIDDSNDETAPVITTATGIAQVPLSGIGSTAGYGDPPHDVYYWSLVFYDDAGTDKVALHVASQRTNLESPAAVTYTPANDLTLVYDGCSQTAGEEIGGAVIWRDIQAVELTLGEIQTLWDSQPTSGGSGLSLGLGVGGGGMMPPWRRRRR